MGVAAANVDDAVSLAQPELHQWAEPTCSEKHSGLEWLSALEALTSTTIVSAA